MGMRNCAGNLIAGLTVMDDILMRNVLNQTECTEYVLQTIMGQKELKVLECVVQKDYKNLQGRSAIFDCVARDAEDRRYDVEIQNDGDAASPQRARYHSGLMDMHMLRPGQDFSELPESHVIFITEDDVLGHGLPIYHAGRKVHELDKDLGDGEQIIYVNAGIQDDTELGHLMRDLHCKNADEMYSSVLAKRIRELKETEEGISHMSDEMRKEMETWYQEGAEFGEMKAKRETALSLAEMGFPVERIAQVVKESISCVKQWIAEGTALAR